MTRNPAAEILLANARAGRPSTLEQKLADVHDHQTLAGFREQMSLDERLTTEARNAINVRFAELDRLYGRPAK